MLALIPSASADSLSYSISLQYDSGKLSLKSIDLVAAASPMKTADGVYTARIISFKGETLYQTSFNINLGKFYSLPVSKNSARRNDSAASSSVSLLLPYYPNAKSVAILKNGETALSIDAGRFSACNENSICDAAEGIDSCPQDCTCGNGKCDANENYNTCSKDCLAISKQGSALPIIPILAVAGTIALIAIAYFIRKNSEVKRRK